VHPLTHLLASWNVARIGVQDKRDALIVTTAGIAPDVDGLGFFAELFSRDTAHPLYWYSDYHHVLLHNLGGALAAAAVAMLCGLRRGRTALLALLTFHLHLLCDLVGSKSADGYHWPIPYLEPFSSSWQWSWRGQWRLTAWPNVLFTVLLIALTLYLDWRGGESLLGLFSKRANRALISTLRRRVGTPRGVNK